MLRSTRRRVIVGQASSDISIRRSAKREKSFEYTHVRNQRSSCDFSENLPIILFVPRMSLTFSIFFSSLMQEQSIRDNAKAHFVLNCSSLL